MLAMRVFRGYMVFLVRVSNRIRILVWIVLIICGYIGGLIINEYYSLPCNIVCMIVGLVLLAIIFRAAGVTGRYLAVYGKSDQKKEFGEIDQLVTVGPYSCMRHPMHFFLSLIPIALGLITMNPGYAYIIAPLETILILLMAVIIDEKESIERFGEKYLEYKKRVPAFNLSPRCLWKALSNKPSK